MDAVDRAQELEQIDRHAVLSTRPKPTGVSAFYCDDCGDEIPAQRRNAVQGVKYCIDCQPYHEK